MSDSKPHLDIMVPTLPMSIEQPPHPSLVIDYFFTTSTD